MRTTAVLAGVLLANAIPAAAQKPKPGFSAQHEIRLRYEGRESVDFNDANANDPKDALGRLRLGLKWGWENGSSVFFQPQFSVQDRRRGRASNGTDLDPHVHQLFADVNALGGKWRVGRQELIYGDERLIGAANWLNKGRSWDGAKVSFADARTRTELFGATLGQFDLKTTTPTLAGAYSTVRRRKDCTYDLYLLYKHVGLSPTTSQSVYTLGTRPVIKLVNGIDAKVEAAYQFGSNAGRPVTAYAVAAVVGYTPRSPIGLRLYAEYDYASGGNPTGSGTYRTFDQLFPTNHVHYGLADFVGWRNMQDIRVGAQAKPSKRWNLSIDGHFFRLADSTDFWYGELGRPVKGATGAQLHDPTGAAGSDLGSEFDISASYALGNGATLAGGFARFMPGSFVKRLNGGKADASNWLYVQGLYAF